MKKNLLLCFYIVSGLLGCSSSSLEGLELMGTNNFSKDAWVNASQEERGKMVFSLLKKYDIKKMKVEEIKNLLGESTAYYEYDEFPAYLVGPRTIQSQYYGKGYVLAFPFDRSTGFIREYIIMPNPQNRNLTKSSSGR